MKTTHVLLCALMLLGCPSSDDDVTTPDTGDDGAPDTADPDDATPPDEGPTPFTCEPDESGSCDDSQPPIMMAHGFLASGDTWNPHVQRFSSRGWCTDRIRAFDWNTLPGAPSAVPALDAAIDALLADTGADKVVLIGHSMGGGLGYDYLADDANAAKVDRYIHVGSNTHPGPAHADVPMLNLWSVSDLVVEDKGDIEGATNVMLESDDHYEVATSDASFAAIYEFVAGEAPSATSITPQDCPVLRGKAIRLGENDPLSGGTVEVFRLDPDTAERQGDPVGTFTIAEDGGWGPQIVDPTGAYEFFVRTGVDDDRPVHYYFEPFTRSSELVYLRALPTPGSTAGALLSAIPYTDENAVAVLFSQRRAIISGRDELTLDGDIDLATEALASADQTLLALFLYDADENGKTDQTKAELFGALPFLNGVDVFLPANTAIEVGWNGRTVRARAWPAESEGALVIVLD